MIRLKDHKEVKAGIEKREVAEERIFKAMQFRVGGAEQAVVAKSALRQIEADFKPQKRVRHG